MFEYFITLGVIAIVTLLLEFIFHVHLYRSVKERTIMVALFFVIGIVWDSFAVIRGHWIFPAGKNLGVVIGVLPLEEYLFFLIIPYFILTAYKIIDAKFTKTRRFWWLRNIS